MSTNDYANQIITGDALAVLRGLPDGLVQTCITSPPYFGLRDYNVAGQIGLEDTPEAFIDRLVEVFREVRRVLHPSGTLWVNIGDSYANDGKWGGTTGGKHVQALHGTPIGRTRRQTGLKPKDLMMIPARLALALQADGWWLRSDIIWVKPTAMPEPVTDRPTSAHEHIFLLAKQERYYYDADAIREPLKPKTFTTFGIAHQAQGNDGLGRVKSDNWGRTVHERQPRLAADGTLAGANKRNVWTVASQPYSDAHFATFPPKLIEPCILAGSSPRACPVCSAPWERVTEREGGNWEGRKAAGAPMRYGLQSSKLTPANRMGESASITTGWQSTCSCPDNDGSGKSIVLDPFLGAGTTALVALQHGRSYLGIELNPEYVELATKRLATCQMNLWTSQGEDVPA